MKQFIVRPNNSELDQAVLYSGMQLSKEDIEHVVWSSYLLLYWDRIATTQRFRVDITKSMFIIHR